MNSDFRTLDVIISNAFKYWEQYSNVSNSESLDLLHTWVNLQSLKPDANLKDDLGFDLISQSENVNNGVKIHSTVKKG